MFPRIILASRSVDSSASKRVPLTVPAVPIGMKTGVSMTPRLVLIVPVLASSQFAVTVKLIGGFILILVSSGLVLAFAALLVAFDNSQGRPKEVELFAKPILQVALIREMQAGLSAGSENHKRGRAHRNLG